MASIHQIPTHRHRRRFSGEPSPMRPVPFFEFMIYGARAYAVGRSGGRLVCVSRGRSLTLVEAPGMSGR